MSAEYSEDKLVQQTTADYFHNNLGWDSEYAFNTETFGSTGTLGRTTKREVILTRDLRQALERLNPGHPAIAYDTALQTFLNINLSKTPIQINRDTYKLIRDGIPTQYKAGKGETRDLRLKVIDFTTPDPNRFLIVRELWVQGSLYTRRPDIIGFVNGIPLLFIELKKTSKDIQLAYDQNLTDYKDTIPHIFHYNAIVLLSNGNRAKYGSFTSPYLYFQEWKRLKESEKGRVDFETLLMGIGNKANFLDLVENFILFDESSGKTTKIIARNHQFLGVNLAFEAIQRRKMLPASTKDILETLAAQDSSGLQVLDPACGSGSLIQNVLSQQRNRLGVFWHTQGSGKSYSIAFLAEKILRKLGGYSFVIVTDRQELDRQIAETFVGIGAISPQQTVQATSGDHLGELLKGNHRYVFTLVHKFNQPGKEYSDRDNIIVISDEAHRTQYGKLAENMRDGLRNAGFIGFTGTPLMGSAEDQKTREMFGDYVSVYDFQRAVEDQATVPLYYDNRSEKLDLHTDDLNVRISSEIEAHDLSDEDEARLIRRLGNDYLVLTAESRLDRIAEDLVAHYTARWETGKAMLVCLDKLTAIRMYDLIDRYWKRAIAHQETEVKIATDEQDLREQQRNLQWLKETEYAVVISKEQNEVKTFRNHKLDIEPHRLKIESRDLEDDFKKPDHPFRLAIVCAMWLTGFDVPTLATLYLDKAMQGHSLMQAIARANRVAEGKNNGLLVDYSGILKSLRAALAKYGSVANPHRDSTQEPTAPYEDTIALAHAYADAIQACIEYLHSIGCNLHQLPLSEGFDKIALLNEAIEAITTNDLTRARFDVLACEVFKKHTALINYPQLSAPYRSLHNTLEAICDELSPESSLTDLSTVLRSLQQLVSDTITVQPADHHPGGESGRIYDISNINFDALKAEFTKSERPNQTVQDLKQAVETRLKQMVAQNPTRLDFYDRYQKIIHAYNQETDRVTIEQTFEELMRLVEQLSEEDTRAVREGLNEDHLAIFDLLCQRKTPLSSKNRDRVKSVAQSLYAALTTELQKLDNWQDKDTTRSRVKTFVHNYLYDETTGLPVEDYTEEDVQEVADVIFLHVYERFSSLSRAA